jgi:hypothetical protein
VILEERRKESWEEGGKREVDMIYPELLEVSS